MPAGRKRKEEREMFLALSLKFEYSLYIGWGSRRKEGRLADHLKGQGSFQGAGAL